MTRQSVSGWEKPAPWAWQRQLLEPRFRALARGLGVCVPAWSGARPVDVISRNQFLPVNSANMNVTLPGWGMNSDGGSDGGANKVWESNTRNGILNPTGPISVIVIAQIDTDTSWDTLFEIDSAGRAGGGGGFGLLNSNDDSIAAFTNASGTQRASSGSTTPYGEPLLFGMTLASSGSTPRLYLFGLWRKYRQLVLANAAGSISVSAPGGNKMKVLAAWASSTTYQDFTDGKVFALYIWNRVLADAEVKLVARDPYGLLRPAQPQRIRWARRPAAGGAAVALDGVATAVSTMAAALTVARKFTAADASVSALTGALSATRTLASTLAAVSQMAGALTVARKFTATDASLSTLAGAVRVARALTSTDASASTMTGQLSVTSEEQVAGTLAASSSLVGALRVTRSIAGAMSSLSVLAGNLRETRALAGSTVAASTMVGAGPRVARALTGTAAAVSAMLGQLLTVAPEPSQTAVAGDSRDLEHVAASRSHTWTAPRRS